MKIRLILGALAVARCLDAQVAKAVQPPIAFPQCGGPALFDYQVEYQARFQPDSSLDVAPTDTAGMGNIVQFVVDSLGHVIPESLVARKTENRSDFDQAKTDLPRWRYVPAHVGGRAACQVIVTYTRRRGARTPPPARERQIGGRLANAQS